MSHVLRVLGIAVLWALCAHASTLYNNLDSAPGGGDAIHPFGPLFDSFLTGPTAYNLIEIQLKVKAGASSDSTTVAIYADSGTGGPGGLLTVIGNATDNMLSDPNPIHVFSLLQPYELARDARYWVGLSSSSNTASWAWSTDQSGIGVQNEYFSNSSGTYPNASSGPYQMLVLASPVPTSPPPDTPVPEPGACSMLALGLFVFWAVCLGAARRVP